jgi:hypothetical protein
VNTTTITIDTADVEYWHKLHGSDSVAAWCQAHGWDPDEIAIPVVIDVETATVHARRYRTDENGKRFIDRTGEVATEEITAPLRRVLPRGVGQVS